MNLERLLQRTLAFQAIPAPTFDENARARFLIDELKDTGVQELGIDDAGNVLARIPGGSLKPLVVSAHMDTVFPADTDLKSDRDDTEMTGPGIGDNALGLASLVELALDFRASPPPGDVWLAATTCEEGLGNLRGIRAVVDRFGESVAAYIVVEGMALGHVYTRGLPVRRYRIAVQTPGGHSWVHAGRRSAIHELISIGAELVQVPLPRNPRTTMNIGRVEGGTTINSIASQAWMDVDLRCELEPALEMLADWLRDLVARHNRDAVRTSLTDIGSRPGAALPAGHPLFRAAQQALLEIGEPAPEPEPASTDASYPLSRGLPAICVGLTRGSDAHSLKERIEIGPIALGYASLVSLIDKALRLGTPARSTGA